MPRSASHGEFRSSQCSDHSTVSPSPGRLAGRQTTRRDVPIRGSTSANQQVVQIAEPVHAPGPEQAPAHGVVLVNRADEAGLDARPDDGVHPVAGLPGGWSKAITKEEQQEIEEIAHKNVDFALPHPLKKRIHMTPKIIDKMSVSNMMFCYFLDCVFIFIYN